MKKLFLQIMILVICITVSFSSASRVDALATCGFTYNVQAGDTLSGIAAKCGTTMAALWLANPGLGSWVYTGQVLVLPGASWQTSGGYLIYIVSHGDSLKAIAARYGTTIEAISALNGIQNYNLIYAGQRLTIPTGSYVPPPAPIPPAPPQALSTYSIQPGDTLRKLAYRWGVRLADILSINPQITNASVIYVGQVIYIPGKPSAPHPSYYTVKPGDTLQMIAYRFGTNVYNLQLLNPQIWNINWIYTGTVLRVQ